MYDAAELIGSALRAVRDRDGPFLMQNNVDASASFLVGGQIAGERPRLFLVYPEGNFIETTDDTPFFQIGEHKYGKPILDRVVKPDTSLADARKAMLLSMDSTLRSNLSVGMPLDLAIIVKDECRVSSLQRIEDQDPDFQAMSAAWSNALRDAFQTIEI